MRFSPPVIRLFFPPELEKLEKMAPPHPHWNPPK